MTRETKEKLIQWSLGKNNQKWIPQGGEILKYIGSEMLFVDFEKKDVWTAKEPTPVAIQRIGDYDPMTGTYSMTWTDKDKKEHTERITPEGFSFNDPDKEGWMHRFVSYSLHFKMMEEELYYGRLRKIYDKNQGVLGIEPIEVLVKGKQEESLKYHNYIAAVIDTETENGIHEGILEFRIHGITKLQKRSKSWCFGIKDQDGYLIMIPKYQETPEGWIAKDITLDGKIIGDLKIIDIEDEKNTHL